MSMSHVTYVSGSYRRYSVRSLMSVDLPNVALKTITKPADVMILELIALNSEYLYEYEWETFEVCVRESE